jgi:cytochrome c peroxidase
MRRRPKFLHEATIGLAASLFVLSAQAAGPVVSSATGPSLAELKSEYKRPDAIPFPRDNPYSDAKATLGQMLFFDPRLSIAGTMSCATCHNPALSWQDGLKVGVGHDEKQLPRATPTILDLAWADLLMWDGRKNSLEDQASGPVSTAAEMGGSLDTAVARVSAVPAYRHAFKAAFGTDEITFARIALAIATFERTEVSNKSPFDRWIDGDETAINDAAKRGFLLFNGKANCAACHSGWRMTDDGFHDIGLPSPDPGRGAQVPGVPILQHAFKTPTLRNVAERAPYMHDGSIATLHDVVVHYDTGFVERASLSPEIHRLGLSEQEVQDVVAFLDTLTSRDDPVAVPRLPVKGSDQ